MEPDTPIDIEAFAALAAHMPATQPLKDTIAASGRTRLLLTTRQEERENRLWYRSLDQPLDFFVTNKMFVEHTTLHSERLQKGEAAPDDRPPLPGNAQGACL